MAEPSPTDYQQDAPAVFLTEASYRLLFDAVPDPILIATETGDLIDANEPAAALTGYERAGLRRMRAADLFGGEGVPLARAFERLRSDGVWQGELDVRRKDGTLVPVEVHATRIALREGTIVTALLHDISLRRQTEFLQREREERVRLITDALPVLISYIDRDRRYRFMNRTYLDWFQRPRRFLIGRPIVDVIGEDSYAIVREYVDRALAGERVAFETLIPNRMGGSRYISASYIPHRDVTGDVLGFVALVIDLTERKRAEDSSRFMAEASAILAGSLDYEATLRRLAELAVPRLADACVVDMLDGRGVLRRLAVSSVNPPRDGWVWSVGEAPLDPNAPYGPAKVLRTGESELIPEITDEMITRAARTPEHAEMLRKSRIVSHMIVPLSTRERTLGTITFLTSRSGRRYGEDDLALAEELARRAALAVDNARLYQEAQMALRVREEFLSSVTHDLRTPLTSIKGRAQLLLRRVNRGDAPSPAMLQEGLEVIDNVADRMTGLVEELVDLGRLETGHPLELQLIRVDLVSLAMEAAAEQQRNAPRHQIHVIGDEPVTGDWDPVRLERVLVNLLSNAVRYSPEGGDVLVTVRADNGEALLSVQDAGVGIPATDLPRVFDRFHRGANVAGRIPGAGIGLAGVKQIVEMHGGRVRVESTEGSGTTVTLWLPLAISR